MSGVLKCLWTAEAPSQDYDDALAGPEGRHLKAIGFSHDRMRSGLPCLWEGPDYDREQAAVLLNTAARGLAAHRERVARERAQAAACSRS